jgi:hypothetical protein
MPEIGTSGLMSGDGKRGGANRQHPRLSSTLLVDLEKPRESQRWPRFDKGISNTSLGLIAQQIGAYAQDRINAER